MYIFRLPHNFCDGIVYSYLLLIVVGTWKDSQKILIHNIEKLNVLFYSPPILCALLTHDITRIVVMMRAICSQVWKMIHTFGFHFNKHGKHPCNRVAIRTYLQCFDPSNLLAYMMIQLKLIGGMGNIL